MNLAQIFQPVTSSNFKKMLGPFLLIYGGVGIAVIATTAAIQASSERSLGSPPRLR